MIRTTGITLFLLAILLCGCNSVPSDYEVIKAQNDSLRQAKELMEQEVNGFFESVNSIQQSIDKMKQMEGVIDLEQIGGEQNDALTKINRDVAYLGQMLQRNRQELQQLQESISRSRLNIKQLEQTVASLNKQLGSQSQTIQTLRSELDSRTALIAQMSDTIRTQSDLILELSATSDQQQQTITEQESTITAHEQTISTAWYVFGTRKELKDQGIVAGKSVLQNDFNKDYFVKIDTRKTNLIPLYSTRAKILSTHPTTSYQLQKIDGNYVLQITDAEQFWSISKYLVIEVD
ncbi:MAG: hypothetical protein IJ680_04090 [Paludibacteraceae bacterium]|nr:hypothetical protein [Paludibacteraceae bacterium]